MSVGDAIPMALPRDVSANRSERRAWVNELVQREAGDLLDYFLRRTASPDDAADLLGETLLVLWRRERAIPNDPTRARMWMFGVARKVLAGQRRSTGRRAALAARLAAAVTQESSSRPDADEHGLRELIERLDPLDQEIVKLVYWDGFSLVHAASLLGMRPATVRSRHARARTALREALQATAHD